MNTQIIQVSSTSPEEGRIETAAEVLRQGGLVAFPTETVYGLGADAMNAGAVKRVFEAKGRPSDNPLIVHIASIDQLFTMGAGVSSTAKKLAEIFWPGPLTLVVKRKPFVPDIVTGGLDTVALRIPNHRVPVALVKRLSHGIVGPSANLSGRPSPTTARHVYDDLNGKIEMILDAGPAEIGVESTVIDTTTEPPTMLRPGGLTREQLESVIGSIRMASDNGALKRSPGTRYRHYAPRAKVELIDMGNRSQYEESIRRYRDNGLRVGSIVHTPQLASLKKDEYVFVLPPTIEDYARELFDAMRRLDMQDLEIILIEKVPETGLGSTVMDRLKRAARKI